MRPCLSTVLLAALALLSAPFSAGANMPGQQPQSASSRLPSREEALERFPKAEKGMVRHVFYPPRTLHSERNRLELIAGKNGPVKTAFSVILEGSIERKDGYFVVQTTGKTHQDKNDWSSHGGNRFWRVGDAPALFANVPCDPWPVVVYAPEGLEVKYRVWTAEKEFSDLPPETGIEIAWADLVSILRREGIGKAAQTPERQVTVTTGTGKHYTSVEPMWDDITRLEKEIGEARTRLDPSGAKAEGKAGDRLPEAPGQAQPTEIAWADLVPILRQEGLEKAVQTKARQVTVTTGSGKCYTAVEPRLDDIVELVKTEKVHGMRTRRPGVVESCEPVIATE